MAPRAGPTSPSTSTLTDVALYTQPCDVTIVEDFLRPWVTSGDTNAGGAVAYVHAADLYSADPEKLARRFQPAVSQDGSNTWYFLSPLRSKSPRDRRKVRAVADGTGCWHSEAGPKNVVDHVNGGRHVGYRQSFSFMRRNDDGVDVRAGWVMAEFHLHHNGLKKKVEGLVLCKMYRSPRNHGPSAVAPDVGNNVVRSGVAVDDEESNTVAAILQWRSRAPDVGDNVVHSSVVVDDEDSNSVTTRLQQRTKNSDSTAIATTMTKKVVCDDEVSGTTTAAETCPKNKAVVGDDEDFLMLPPARKKMRVAVVDTESSGTTLALKAMAGDDPGMAAQLHCPQCGFHIWPPCRSSVVPRGDVGYSSQIQIDKEEHQAMGY